MPTRRTLSGVLLDQEYNKKREALQQIIGNENELGLVTDGWTNIRGDHIVNFLVKAPSRPSMFYKSINTTGRIQNADNVADDIIQVLEEIGAEKFSSVVTDNAPVLRSAWTELGDRSKKSIQTFLLSVVLHIA